ncbi:MAG: energy transducer TonB [Puniceicoccaceae bacterium]
MMYDYRSTVEKPDRRTRQRNPREDEERRNREGLFAAILLAFFLHLLLFWATPRELFEEPEKQVLIPQSMEIMLEAIPEQPEMEETYVRAAPNVQEQVPEETLNISDRNQVAAQEEAIAALSPDNTPYVEGDEEESNRLIQGNPNQEPTPPSPPAASPTSAASPVVQQEAAPREQPVQVDPDYIEQAPETDEGIASIENPAEAQEEPEEPTEPLEEVLVTSEYDGQGQAEMTTPAQAAQQPTPTPRPRLRVERDTSFGPIKDNRQGAIVIGRLAFDAQYSEFGEYWRRVAEIIEARWRNLVYNTRAIPPGGRVVVQFSITRDGQVTDVKVAHTSAGKLADTISVDAIVGEAPYFEWTPEMIVKMGEKAPCAIHFYY